MDRFEQLTEYFKVASEFHENRDISICNVVALHIHMPRLLDNITQPTLRCKLQHLMASNAHLLPSPASQDKPLEPGSVS